MSTRVDTQDETEVATEAEVLDYLGPIADRIADVVAAKEPHTRAAILEVLTGDEGARALMAAAFESGREDAARAMLLAKDGRSAPDWSDVDGLGERRLIAREESACSTCIHVGVCTIARSIPAEMLVTIGRCSSHARRGA